MAGKWCFDEWLAKFGQQFLSFNDTEKNAIVRRLLNLCGPVQLLLLSNELELLVKRDFLHHLPTELCYHVLKWLDHENLLRCCLVSKQWNKVISGCNKAWRDTCENLGVARVIKGKNHECLVNWKLKLLEALRRLKRMNGIENFATRILCGHTSRVLALHYKDGLLASGCDDRTVRLWDLKSAQCKCIVSCHTCADLKFDVETVLTASFDNTLAMWEWSSGNCLVKYQGHVGAVFCVDYSHELDLVVSGSSDCAVKLWQMSTGSCLVTKLGHKNWVTSILLRKVHLDCQSKLRGRYIVLSMDGNSVKVWSTNVSENHCILTLPCSKPPEALLPRLQCNGKDVVCSSDKGICIWSLETFQLTRLFTAFCNRWLVAYGEIFSVLLDERNLYILNNKREQCVSKIPLSRMHKWSRGSGFVSCEESWLNDCSLLLEHGVVFATSKSDQSICLIEWNELT